MRNLRIVCVATVAMLGLAVAASAADRAVSKSKLGSMGLSSMKVLADKDGLAVRGQGTSASVGGSTHTQLFGNTADSSYTASASHYFGPSTAYGAGVTAVHVGPFTATAFSGSYAHAQ